MVSHRFVSPDHQLQESVFASGKKVIVNFGDTESIYDGKIIKAKGFIILE